MTITKTNSINQINWESKKENLKAKFPILTDEDLHYECGQKDGMFKNLKSKLGLSDDELAISIITI
jgi:hypothetical protein